MKRVCLFTGASGTLGNAFSRIYADRYEIAAVYRARPPTVPSQLQCLVDPLEPESKLPENAHRVFAIQADLTDERELAHIVDLVLARFERVDLLVNAAVYSVWAPMIDSDRLLESVGGQFFLNVIVPLKLSVMIARKYWRDRERENVAMARNVVNVSSIAGLRIYPNLGQSAYSASKAALNHLTRHMAAEFKNIGVRVNAVAPNSFPRIVSVEAVAAHIVKFDQSAETGKIMVLDAGIETLI